MTVFYEIATINNPIAEPFAVMRIDTEKVVGDEHGTGVEGVVVSTHWTREEAEAARAPLCAPCEYCGPGIYTGLPGNACENCMNTGLSSKARVPS